MAVIERIIAKLPMLSEEYDSVGRVLRIGSMCKVREDCPSHRVLKRLRLSILSIFKGRVVVVKVLPSKMTVSDSVSTYESTGAENKKLFAKKHPSLPVLNSPSTR